MSEGPVPEPMAQEPLLCAQTHRYTSVGGRIGPLAHAVLHHACAPVAVVPHD